MDNDWLPIADVPLNERVLVAIPYDDHWELFVDSVDEDGEWEVTEGDATHWQRLPAPPVLVS